MRKPLRRSILKARTSRKGMMKDPVPIIVLGESTPHVLARLIIVALFKYRSVGGAKT
jgi:hypothetical protein